jgi:energy-coupling factor transporter ATP-binding protein EcfA2
MVTRDKKVVFDCMTCGYPIYKGETVHKEKVVNYFASNGRNTYYSWKTYGGTKEAKTWIQCDWCIQEWEKEKARDRKARWNYEQELEKRKQEIEIKKSEREEEIQKIRKKISWYKNASFLILGVLASPFLYFFVSAEMEPKEKSFSRTGIRTGKEREKTEKSTWKEKLLLVLFLEFCAYLVWIFIWRFIDIDRLIIRLFYNIPEVPFLIYPPEIANTAQKFRFRRRSKGKGSFEIINNVNNSNELVESNEKHEEYKLNKEQELVEKLVLEGQNVFLTGGAGTGKSFLLRHLIKLLQEKHGAERVGVTSTTGIGAIIIKGTTIHSFLRLGMISHLPEEILLRKAKTSENWRKIQVLIIDEISMLDGTIFEKLEKIARVIRWNDVPFGGIQLLLVGDFAQLPPVSKKIVYCFEVSSWEKCINHSVNLTQVYRQKEDWFINCLEDIRFGTITKEKWEDMINRLTREPDWPDDGIEPTTLFSTKAKVKEFNEKQTTKLFKNKSYSFSAHDEERFPNSLKRLIKDCPAYSELELRVGTQVMLIVNKHELELVNGSQGVVVGFTREFSALFLIPYPIVRFDNGEELVIKEHVWDKIEGYNEKGQVIISASRRQIPLIPSWAITIHKSQGQSIARLKIDASDCFANGQVYVALSRATNPQYLQIINSSYQKIKCDEKVANFYRTLSFVPKEVKTKEGENVEENTE